MLAATDGALPGLTWLYFALCQLPIYLSPQLLMPIARRLVGRARQQDAVAMARSSAPDGSDAEP
jgi:BASS family bile acid:Na+ symporter